MPTRAFVFKGEVADIGPNGMIAGYLRPAMRSNYAAVRLSNLPLSQALQHEYTHFLVRNQGHQAYPNRTYLLECVEPAKGLPTLGLAHELLPSNPEIKVMLAQMYVAVGRAPEARPLLRAVIAWETGKRAGFAARLLAGIDGNGGDGKVGDGPSMAGRAPEQAPSP